MFNSTDKYKYQYKYNALEKLISSTDFYFTPFLISHKETPKVGISNEKCDDILKNQNINQIHLCFYEIFYSDWGKHPPFLRFLLEKKENDKQITFPTIHLIDNSKELEIEIIQKKINEYFQILFKEDNISFSKEKSFSFIIQGIFKDLCSDTYLFIDITKMKLNLDKMFNKYFNLTNSYWLITIHEMVNEKKVGNIQIDKKVSNFFTTNVDFIFLQNEINIDYEIPTVVYQAKPYSQIEYCYVFGQYYVDYDSFNKRYFYFTDFEKAIQDAKEEKKGIIRYALFTGKLFIIQKENDILDLIEEEYDCFQINSEKNSNYLIKNFSQNIPLSFHYIHH